MSTYTVRQALPEDAEAFTECHVTCWREAYADLWGADRLAALDPVKLAVRRRAEIAAGVAHHMLAEQDGEVLGIAIAGPSRDEPPVAPTELYAIYLRRVLQGSGVADDLLSGAVGDGPVSLWVYRDNPRAAAFYVHNGFIPDGGERLDPEGILEIRMARR